MAWHVSHFGSHSPALSASLAYVSLVAITAAVNISPRLCRGMFPRRVTEPGEKSPQPGPLARFELPRRLKVVA